MNLSKVKKAEMKTCYCAYLYEDGHLVVMHEKADKDAGTVSWVTIYESVGIKCQFKGRLIIDQSALSFILHAKRIAAFEPSLERGSENTRKLGIRTGTIVLYNGTDHRGWIISSFPDLISCDVKHQPETVEKFEDIKNASRWCIEKVKTIYKVTDQRR